ncbi:hypothetical protein [Hydrogenophaga pseudoflava]|uniref:hypothetical protein n=1 Tax=Hydrogenophaga pseudoflava TaxID=47421 RepID=UPI0027E40B29|nr:hypothetical protein [Hydrogenophaga pseudoflava]MDQ7745073.1 hypothetical protein [Hydrogenophaga pseudoflava]
MKPKHTSPPKPATTDPDLAEQARPGHGIPSQDPDIEAQMPLEPWEAEREAQSVLAGGGMMVGAAAGAAIGTAVGGPVGALVGGTAGAVAGALGGGAAGSIANPPDESAASRTRPRR